MDIRARKICYRRTDLCNSIPCLYPVGSTASHSSTLYFQHHSLKISMTHCQKPLWANSSMPENYLFKWVCVFSRLEWCLSSLFPWPIWIWGAEKQQETTLEVTDTILLGRQLFSPWNRRGKSQIQKPVLSSGTLLPETQFRKWTVKTFGEGVSILVFFS